MKIVDVHIVVLAILLTIKICRWCWRSLLPYWLIGIRKFCMISVFVKEPKAHPNFFMCFDLLSDRQS